MKNGIVGRNDTSLFKYQGWPTICKDDYGVLFVASSGHRLGHVCPFGKNLLYKSYDNGETWSAPIIINDTHLDDRDAGLTYLGDNKILLMWFNHPKEFYSERDKRKGVSPSSMISAAYDIWKKMPDCFNIPGSFTKLSTDGGNTWGNTYKCPLTAPHGPTLLKNGDLFILGRAFWDDSIEEGEVYSAISKNEGKTWKILSKVEHPDEFSDTHIVCEPHAIELENGDILGAIRVEDKTKPYDYTVHLCKSTDGGATWSKPMPTGICGSPPHFFRHSSGAIILTYGRRIAPCGQYAIISYDEGKSWSNEISISPTSPDWDHGYPSTTELKDGSLITVYYQKWPGDTYNSILYSKWELPK